MSMHGLQTAFVVNVIILLDVSIHSWTFILTCTLPNKFIKYLINFFDALAVLCREELLPKLNLLIILLINMGFLFETVNCIGADQQI